MRLFRMDAMHEEGDGSLTRFYRTPEQAYPWMQRMIKCGWACDLYRNDLTILPQAAERLLEGIWPNEPDEVLLHMSGDPLAQAISDLDQLKARRGHAQ